MIQLENALMIHLRLLGNQHHSTATTLACIGNAYGKAGDHNKAVMCYEQALPVFKETFGQHPMTAQLLAKNGHSIFRLQQSQNRP